MDNDPRVRWFGESWGAPITRECVQVPTPVGRPCKYCDRPIEADDRGFMIWHHDWPSATVAEVHREPWHLACFMRSIGVSASTSLTSPTS